MKQTEVKAFFDRLAPGWDSKQDLTDAIAAELLEAADVKKDAVVLDVGCGTGVLFPYYVSREVRQVLAVDLSSEMIRIAREKQPDARITLICADVETLPVRCVCDAVMLFNCFPHFPEPERLFERLSHWLKPGGRLTVAHNMSLEKLNAHHVAEAEAVSRSHITEEEIRRQMEPYFKVDRLLSREDAFCISGTK